MRMLSPLATNWSLSNHGLTPLIFKTEIDYQTACDIRESEDHYLISYDMPGVRKEDIKIEVQKNELLISGERQNAPGQDRPTRKFEKTFTLANTIDTEKIEAQYENGVLQVALPKAESAKPRIVQIQSSPTGFFNKLLN